MTYTEGQKNQLREFIQDGLVRVGIYMRQTMGFPLEVYLEKIERLETCGDQMKFLEDWYRRHPNIFKGMKAYEA